jgi:hypothetical protein
LGPSQACARKDAAQTDAIKAIIDIRILLFLVLQEHVLQKCVLQERVLQNGVRC